MKDSSSDNSNASFFNGTSDELLPAFTTRQYSHLPTPQSPKHLDRYNQERQSSPKSPVVHGLLSTSASLHLHRPRLPSADGLFKSELQQCLTPESSPQFSYHSPPKSDDPAIPQYFVSSSSADFSTPKQLSKMDITNPPVSATLFTSTPSPSLGKPEMSSTLSSPFTAKLSHGENSSKSSHRQPVHVDDVFSSRPSADPTILVTAIPSRPSSPHLLALEQTTNGGGEMERIRQSMLEDRMTQIREAEKRRPDYLKRAKRTLVEADANYLEDDEDARHRDRPLTVGIMESPHKGRRLKLFQETSEESFEESLMAGGYGRYRTADWVRQPQPIALPSAVAGSSTIVSILEEAQEAPPTEKELKKRKRLAAFKSKHPQNGSKLYAVELEGKGRVLIEAPSSDERVIPVTPEPAPSKKKANNRRKKKITEVVDFKKTSGNSLADDQAEKPNWPDTEFPWRLRTEERIELAKAEEEERLRWIEKFLDRDSDDSDEADSNQQVPEQMSATLDTSWKIPLPGRGKMVPLSAFNDYTQMPGLPKRMAFPSDPADALSALLSKKSVRALSYRQRKRQMELDNEDDDEVVCICNGKDDGSELVQCDACETWYHLRCIGIKCIADLGKEEDPWFCNKCIGTRSPSSEPENLMISEPTFAPTDNEPSVRRTSDTPFFQPSLQDSPNWTSARTPRTPTRSTLMSDSNYSWVESSRAGPSTPQHAPPVRIYSSPYDGYGQNYEESPFDPTSTPSRGIKFHAPFATPKNNGWNPRMGGGLFHTPCRPVGRGAPKGNASQLASLDDNNTSNPLNNDYFNRVLSYDESPIRRSNSDVQSPPIARTNVSFLEESPVMRSVGSQFQDRRGHGGDEGNF